MKKIFLIFIPFLLCGLISFSQTTCLSGNCQNGIGKQEVKSEKLNYTYEGAFKEGKKDGKGIISYKPPYPVFNVTSEYYLRLYKFEGDFVNNQPQLGDYYPIEYKKGKLTGKLNEQFQFHGSYTHTTASGGKETLVFDKGILVTNFENSKLKNSDVAKEENPIKNNPITPIDFSKINFETLMEFLAKENDIKKNRAIFKKQKYYNSKV